MITRHADSAPRNYSMLLAYQLTRQLMLSSSTCVY